MQVGLAGQKMVTRSNIHIRPMRPINVINIRKNYVRADHFQIISSKNIRERERENFKAKEAILIKIRASNPEAHEEKNVVRCVAFNLR